MLDNAVKYTHSQGAGEINICLRSDSTYIYLVIKDNGVGIPEKQLKKIFNPYYRIQKEAYSRGLGIGLFLVKKIIESANGRIEVESKLGKGSTFLIIFLKCKPADNKNIADVVPAKPIEEKKFKLVEKSYDENKHSIMLVEDNPDMLAFLRMNLQDYNVFYAINGKKALDILDHISKPDIIISDIMMEEMDGHEFFNKISGDDRYNDIPFIFLTSRTGEEEKLKSLHKGAVDYIYKPFLMEELKAKIYAILKKLDMVKETKIRNIEEKISGIIRTEGDDKFLRFEKTCKKYGLTPREKEVVQRLIKGLLIKEIAGELFLSNHTIRNHIRRIYKKCEVQNRVELLNLFKK